MLRAAYSLVPARYRMMIGQLRRGRFNSLNGDDPGLARATWADRGQEWARKYLNDTQAPQRRVMLDAVARVAPFGSLLELGCNSGPNLRLIRERYPDARLTGMDISDDAIRCGREASKDIEFRQGTFDQVEGRFDVILSVWSLCCSPPSEIEGVIAKIAESAKSVVIVEPSCSGSSRLLSPLPTWRHDYARLLGGESYPVDLGDIQRVIIRR